MKTRIFGRDTGQRLGSIGIPLGYGRWTVRLSHRTGSPANHEQSHGYDKAAHGGRGARLLSHSRTLVRVMQDDQTSGMSEIPLGGLTKPLWTYNKFLTGRPIRDIYGVVETPNTAGLIDLRDAAVARAH